MYVGLPIFPLFQYLTVKVTPYNTLPDTRYVRYISMTESFMPFLLLINRRAEKHGPVPISKLLVMIMLKLITHHPHDEKTENKQSLLIVFSSSVPAKYVFTVWSEYFWVNLWLLHNNFCNTAIIFSIIFLVL